MEDVRTIKSEREVLETQLKDPITDISECRRLSHESHDIYI